MTSREEVAFRCDLALASVGWLYIFFAYMVVEYRLPNVTVCPFVLLTGSPCPLCGTTHFIGMLLHGVINDDGPRIAGFLWFALVVVVTIASTSWAMRYVSGSRCRTPASWHRRKKSCGDALGC